MKWVGLYYSVIKSHLGVVVNDNFTFVDLILPMCKSLLLVNRVDFWNNYLNLTSFLLHNAIPVATYSSYAM